LVYFRFLGRVMGKALFDRQLVAGHMVQNIYKHMLGWPITFGDLEMVDEEYFNNLKSLETMARKGEDLEMLCLDFSTTQEVMGIKETIDLVKDGATIDVTNDNFPEYLEACLKYRMLDRVKPQLNELLLGFFDVIPEPLLTIFDFQELELLMCGLPEIEMSDWMEHTEYSGEYDHVGAEHQSCKWFWEVVTEFDHELKARLLQFVTGTSGVPSGSFGVLQGNDGNIRKFTIHGVALGVCLYPRAQ
jgi:HECT-domain (ubiquitin-transferase)